MEKNLTKVDAIEILDNNFSEQEVIEKWNEYCEDNNCLDDMIYTNDGEFLDENFSSHDAAVRAVLFGDYHYNDRYVIFNGYANLETFDYWNDANSPIDATELVSWLYEQGAIEEDDEEEDE